MNNGVGMGDFLDTLLSPINFFFNATSLLQQGADKASTNNAMENDLLPFVNEYKHTVYNKYIDALEQSKNPTVASIVYQAKYYANNNDYINATAYLSNAYSVLNPSSTAMQNDLNKSEAEARKMYDLQTSLVNNNIPVTSQTVPATNNNNNGNPVPTPSVLPSPYKFNDPRLRLQSEIENPNSPTNTNTSNGSKDNTVLYVGIAAGLGLLYITKNKNKSKLSGMINFKSIMKNAGEEGAGALLITGGIIASQKFLDFDNLFKNRTAGGFMDNVVKHQGAVKAIAGIIGASAVKNHMIKAVLTGVAIQGIIKELRTFTAATDGTSSNMIPSIGANMVTRYLPGVSGNTNYLRADAYNGVSGIGFPPYSTSPADRVGQSGCPPSSWGKM
jgi:hypothetical protein